MKRRFFPHISIVGAITTSAFAASIGLLGGVALQSVEERLFVLVPLVIALPALNTMAGDYASLIAAHAGDPQNRKHLQRRLTLSLLGAVPISITGVIVISTVLSIYQGYDLDRQFMLQFSAFTAIALTSVVFVVYLLTNALDKYLEKHRVNSDDVLIPFSNVLASVLMLSCFALATWLVF